MRKSLIFAIAALAAVSACTKTFEPAMKEDAKTVNFLAQSIDTKTAFGTPDGTTYPTLWTSKDSKVKIDLNADTKTQYEADVHASADFKTATFSANVVDTKESSYIFRVATPSSAALGYAAKGWSLNIPSTQTPGVGTPDEAAMILAATSEAFSEFPTSPISLDFAHVTAYGKLSILNFPASAGAVSKVSLSSDVNFVGRFYYNDGTVTENTGTGVLTLNTSSLSDIWFACAPVDIAGESIKITVSAENGDYSKTITIPAGKNFQSGKIAKISVDFDGISAGSNEYYSLVTSIEDLTVDSEVIIASGTVALSTTQNNNNRAATGITLENSQVKNPSEAVQILTVKPGKVDETIALSVGTGYLYAASSSNNYLKTQATLNDNGSFAVSFDGNNIELKAQGTNSRNIIRYNDGSSNGTQPVFSCYSSGQAAIQMYKKVGSGTDVPVIVVMPSLAAPIITSCSGNESSMTISVSWSDVENATSYHVACGNLSADVNAGVGTATFNVTKYGDYSVTVTAEADGYKSATSTASTVTLVDPNPSTELSTGVITALTASTSTQNLDDNITYKMSASNTYSNPLRVYASSTLTIAAASGYTITKVVFACNTTSYASACKQAEVDVASGASTSVAQDGSTISFSVKGETSSFAFKPAAQVRVDSITVFYKAN